KALEVAPANSDALNGLITVYIVQKDPDKAIAAANAQIAKVPDSSAFYDLLGTALFNTKKDYKGAEAALRKSIDLDKKNSDAVLKLGQVYAAQGSTDEAIATYQQSAKDNPKEIASTFCWENSTRPNATGNPPRTCIRRHCKSNRTIRWPRTI